MFGFLNPVGHVAGAVAVAVAGAGGGIESSLQTLQSCSVPGLLVPGLFGKNLLFGIGSGNVHDGHSASGGMVGCNLARCYGKLRQHLHAMDSQMKVCIGMTIAELNQTRLTNWDDVITCMLGNEALEPMESRTIHRSDTFKKGSVDYFKFDGSPDVTKTREVEQWIKNLISDEDVLKDLNFSPTAFAEIVAQTGATITDVATFFAKSESHKRDVLNIGILRFPDLEHPYFKVYRVKLTAWSHCIRVLFVEQNTNGITGEYHCRRFKPRERYLRSLRPAAMRAAVDMLDELMADD